MKDLEKALLEAENEIQAIAFALAYKAAFRAQLPEPDKYARAFAYSYVTEARIILAVKYKEDK